MEYSGRGLKWNSICILFSYTFQFLIYSVLLKQLVISCIFHQMVLQDVRVPELSPMVPRGSVKIHVRTIAVNNQHLS